MVWFALMIATIYHKLNYAGSLIRLIYKLQSVINKYLSVLIQSAVYHEFFTACVLEA